MQNLISKIVLIVIIIGGCVWAFIPPDQKIRLGRDLSGGVSLVYSVRMPEEGNRRQVLDQTIDVLKERVNPQGVLDIAMTPLGTDRIEVVMPLPNEEVKGLATAFEAELNALVHAAEIKASELNSSLRDGTAVDRFGAEGERGRLVAELQTAFDDVRRLEIELTAMDAQSDAGMVEDQAARRGIQRRLADAEIQYEDLYEQVMAMSLQRSRVVRMLELPQRQELVRGADGRPLIENGEQVFRPSQRQAAMTQIIQEFPDLTDDLARVTTAWTAYEAKRTGLDDPEDLKRLLRGAGVLHFHIAVRSGLAQGVSVDDLRSQLAEVGPENTDSSVARWFPIHDLQQWVESPEQLQSLEANPQAYFSAQPYTLEAAEHDGQVYLLLYTSEPKSMTHDRGDDWALEATGQDVDRMGRPAVSFRLDAGGGKRMARLTGPHEQEPMAIVLDGKVYSAPTLQSQITNSGVITGNFSPQDIAYLTRVLDAGALEARLSPEPIAVSVLGPSLGADNLDRGFNAFMWAVVVVAGFMLVWYFFAGFVADVALLFNGIIIFGVMAMMQGTFTLPGLAGVVLTMGMAVDANVLIYERIREELEIHGARDLREAIREGYNRVFSTIVDANLTNLIVCAVLLLMQPTTEVKGFALTLTIGIIATLFTALFVTRVIFDLYASVFKIRHLPMLATVVPSLGRLLRPKINWVGLRGIFWSLSFCLLVGSFVLFFARGKQMFDTEFRGGVSITMQTRDDGGSRLMLPHMGPESVQSRIRGVADRAGTEDTLENNLLREFRFAKVLTVGTTGVDSTGQTVADGFQVKVSNPPGVAENDSIQDMVEAELLAQFGDQLDISPGRTFAGMGSQRYAQFTRPIEADSVGGVLGREGVGGDLGEFRGGVLVLVEDIQPPVTADDVAQRIDRLRQDPDFSSDTAGREVAVFGLSPDGGDVFTEVAIAVSDPDINYIRTDSALVDVRLAAREWELISTALERQSSFEQVSSFAPSVAQTRTANAIGAVILSLAGILFYIWIRFGSFWYSLAAIVALCHDVVIVLGFLALSGYLGAYEFFWSKLLLEEFLIDTGIVAALLTVIGYSLNDTIVILDRIRENRGKRPLPTKKIINDSINQAFSRTVLTSVTTLIAVLIIYITGGTGIRGFAFALVIGVIVGTYSSVAIASPLVYRRGGRPEPVRDEDLLPGQPGDSDPEPGGALPAGA
ncbi:MAG: protein translocase subunit SecD [Phycisphaerales bacterium]|nr:protein translocase subunit SecD [Phycisphaerales bacterium]